MLTKPKITEEILAQIRQTIEDHPDWKRSHISKYLCELWDWRVPGGTYKDISCRDMLRALDKAGHIELPASQKVQTQGGRRKINHMEHNMIPVACGLGELRPLMIELVESGPDLTEFKSLLDQYHYLGYDRTVGENMKYIVRSRDGILLACLLFGSAAWKCRDRDTYIGWNQEHRSTRLFMLTNNTRFLIFPTVSVPHLASHILSLIAHRIQADWETKYGHGLLLLETFVDISRFRGTCYRAANWIHVGRTTGRGRNDRKHERAIPEKDIFLMPLDRRWQQFLTAEP